MTIWVSNSRCLCVQAVAANAEALVLQLLDGSEPLRQQAEKDQQLGAECHSMLWRHGTHLFDCGQFVRAIALFHASLQYAPSAQEKARAARTVALCYMATQDHERWAEWPASAPR